MANRIIVIALAVLLGAGVVFFGLYVVVQWAKTATVAEQSRTPQAR